jgi:hypothetical protein
MDTVKTPPAPPLTAGYDPLNQGPGKPGPERVYVCAFVVNTVSKEQILTFTTALFPLVP